MGQRTKAAIRQSFLALLNQMPFDKISIRDIAEKSGVTRNTFYYYYRDIYALTEEIFDLEIERIAGRSIRYDSWQAAFLDATEFATENRRAVYHLYNSANRSILERYYHKSILTAMMSFVRKEAEGLPVPEKKIQTLARFYSAALVGLTAEWLREGMKTDTAAFIGELEDMLDGNIRRALERSCENRQ